MKPDITTLQDRDHLGEWLNQNELTAQGVEVGASNGANARQIISTWNGQLLCLVDTWGSHLPEMYRERTDWTDFNACLNECKKLEEEYNGRVALKNSKSLDACGSFRDGLLDFVYIDAAHDRFSVTADIVGWWPKVKSGGVFGGHDFYIDIVFPAYCEVKQVVEDWAKWINQPIHHTPKCGSWWFIKP